MIWYFLGGILTGVVLTCAAAMLVTKYYLHHPQKIVHMIFARMPSPQVMNMRLSDASTDNRT